MKTLGRLLLFVVTAASACALVLLWMTGEKKAQVKPSQKREDGLNKKAGPKIVASSHSLTSRQNAILDALRTDKQLDSRMLTSMLPGVHERTLRRDLVRLQALGLVSKTGSTKSAVYSLV